MWLWLWLWLGAAFLVSFAGSIVWGVRGAIASFALGGLLALGPVLLDLVA